jgi:hypothetical protein
MPFLPGGTFTLRAFRVDTLGTTWFWDPGAFNYYNTVLGPATPAIYVAFGAEKLDTSGHGTDLNTTSPPAGFTPTTSLQVHSGLSGYGGAFPSLGTIEFGSLLNDSLAAWTGVLPDDTPYGQLLDFIRITITSHGSTDAPTMLSDATQLASPASVTGNYAIFAEWWLIPLVDACGETNVSQLQLAATSPGDEWEVTTDPTPTITVLTPSHGTIDGGTPITISGSGFGMDATVTIDGVTADDIVVVDQFTITCTTPAHAAGSVDVVVENVDGVSSTPEPFLYEVVPVELTAIAPPTGPLAGGTPIVLTGRGFEAGATVAIGGAAATSVVVVSEERITAVTPAHAAGATDVVITQDGVDTTLSEGFRYTDTALPYGIQFRTPTGTASGNMRIEGASISQSLGSPSTMRFTANVKPLGESLAQFAVEGVELFAGSVIRTLERTDGAARLQCWDTEAVDYTHKLSRAPHPIGAWEAVSATTIIQAIMTMSAPGFSTAGVEGGLPPLNVTLDGTADAWAAITDICQKCGAKAFLDRTTLHVFTTTSGITLTPVTTSNPDLSWPKDGEPFQIELDYASIVNRVTVNGADGVTATADDATSILAYGISAAVVNDAELLTVAECYARAQQELAGSTQPAKIVHYVTRDLQTRVGAMVDITSDRPEISGTYLVQAVEIDQLDHVLSGARPRFAVTAVPPDMPMARAQGNTIVEDVIDLKAGSKPVPLLEQLPLIPASKLAGCIPSSAMTQTGVTAGTYGDDAHLTAFTVDDAGRITAAETDPVAVLKVDGSQAFTADQSMGGHQLEDLDDPNDPQDAATKAYVDAASTSFYDAPLTNGDPASPELIFDSFGDVVMVTGIPL